MGLYSISPFHGAPIGYDFNPKQSNFYQTERSLLYYSEITFEIVDVSKMNKNLIEQVIWYIESHYAEALTLDHIAAIAQVSRYHLVRAFGAATGYSVMRYLRARRLTIAAQNLANGAHATILDAALATGYSSHEAFTRAFREAFGVTPETIRSQRHVRNIPLVEAMKMNKQSNKSVKEPRFENRTAFLVVGLKARYGEDASAHIPAQWQRFTPYIGTISRQIGETTYGVGYNGDDEGNLDYLCGVAVADFSDVPPELDTLHIPEQRYAIFNHPDHVSTVNQTWNFIWSIWFPNSGYQPADAPFFECYGQTFDPMTGSGGFELWIPIK